MIYVFNKKAEQITELTCWDHLHPTVISREYYLLDAKGRVYHCIMGRLKQLFPWEWPSTIRMTRMILGFGAPS